MFKRMVALLVLGFACTGTMASAQEMKLTLGAAAFLDEDTPFDHFVIGVDYGIKISDRLQVGPQFLFMRGPGNARDYAFLGNVSYDLVEKEHLEVYVAAGVGFLHYRDQFGFGPAFSATGWMANGGLGARFHISERFFIAPEFRIGPEPIFFPTISIGYKF